MKKKVIAILLTSTLCALPLAGCGSNDASNGASSNTDTENSTNVVEPEPDIVQSIDSTSQTIGNFTVNADAVSANSTGDKLSCDGVIIYNGDEDIAIKVMIDADEWSPDTPQDILLRKDSYLPWRASWKTTSGSSPKNLNGKIVHITITPTDGEAAMFDIPIAVSNTTFEDGAELPIDEGEYEGSMTIE